MNDNKKFYWIKLKTNFFNLDEIDFLLTQDNGCKYIVLYQMLCLNTANNDGEMSTRIGEMIIPYDVEKIARDTKYFDVDTVIVALELFKKLGLIYEEENKIFKIANFNEMVGSETSSAKRVREYRQRQKMLQCNTDVTQENRDKRIEIRDKSIDIEKDIEIYNPDKSEPNIPYKEVCEYLNIRTGSNYRYSTRKTKDLIKARFNEGFSLEDFKMVIDKKCVEWMNTDMQKYLRPETLFGSKFESYLNQPTKKLTTKDLNIDCSDFFD